MEGEKEKRRSGRRRRNEARVAATGAPSVTVGAPAPAHSWRALPRCDLWKQRVDGAGNTVRPASFSLTFDMYWGTEEIGVFGRIFGNGTRFF